MLYIIKSLSSAPSPHDHHNSNNYFTFTVNLILLRLYDIIRASNSNPGNRITQINVARPLNTLTPAVNFNNTHFISTVYRVHGIRPYGTLCSYVGEEVCRAVYIMLYKKKKKKTLL